MHCALNTYLTILILQTRQISNYLHTNANWEWRSRLVACYHTQSIAKLVYEIVKSGCASIKLEKEKKYG